MKTASREKVVKLDLKTIRKRVHAIKSDWSPEVTKQRALEGLRRRSELERLLGLSSDLDDNKPFGLVS
jgi:hypothetical protein